MSNNYKGLMSSMMLVIVLFYSVIAALAPVSYAETVYDAIQGNANLSRFVESLERDQISKIWLQTRTATVFAPTNEAFERATVNARESSSTAPLHILGVSVHINQFPITVLSTKPVAAPLSLTIKTGHSGSEHTDRSGNTIGHSHHHHQSHELEYYVDNARIISGPISK